VIDLGQVGYPLIGGRIDILDTRSVAALVYQRHKHLINLFVWPATKRSIDIDVRFDHGYHLCGWNKSGLNYLMISDIGKADLEEFEDLLRGQVE
jgi:anti-sigma factor RsiW